MTWIKSVDLTDAQFQKVSELVKKTCGINLHQGKKELVKARLAKRIRELGLPSFQAYLDHVRQDASGAEFVSMLDSLSTNLTQFFREYAHFRFLQDQFIPEVVAASGRGGRPLRIWSAGCSSGEEPYSLAITFCEHLPNPGAWDLKLLASDISTRMLGRAAQGVYDEARLRDVPPAMRAKYFTCVQSRPSRVYEVKPQLKQLITFTRINLMEPWPMRGPFDVIFCRNVMIYFDKPTQEALVNRYWDLLRPGGMLFLGHSESLAGVTHRYRYVQPTVYRKG